VNESSGSSVLDALLADQRRRRRRVVRAGLLGLASAPILAALSYANPIGGVVLGLLIAGVLVVGTAGGWRNLGAVIFYGILVIGAIGGIVGYALHRTH
jgi:MFS family permease